MPLGRLEKVDLRTEWISEPAGFTPWLAEPDNLKLLAETIGLELAIEGTETSVGPFRADILCKAQGSEDHFVLIENQLERTDHTHLGQIITYASGLGTATIIWIAARFTDEHRAALDWLNEVTGSQIGFFGLEVELWRIGDSLSAPKFNIVSRPNDFVKTSKAEAQAPNSRSALYLAYWSAFRDYVRQNSTVLACLKPQGEYWMDLAPLAGGMRLRAMAGARDRFNMIDFVIYNDADKIKFDKLLTYRSQIEAMTGPLTWRRKDGMKESAVELRRNGPDPSNESDWPNQHRWLLENLEKFNAAFAPVVKLIG